ncbi:MAG TPA: polyhydroxyalkanoate depolymerase [Alphaproteobacteria bacterium]|nr:polyhydroxyalkanoate depolymerase [Alphaproteobacteria bacterium]
MLYQLYEFNYNAAQPLHFFAKALQTALQNPFFPGAQTEFGRLIGASAEMIERSTRRFGKPEFGITDTVIAGEPVAVSEEIVLNKPFCQLRHFVRDTDRDDPRVLVVAPMSGHHATLLRGTVKALLPHHDCYITDWVDAKHVPLSEGTFSFDDYVHYVVAFLRHLGPNTHVLAVCQPAVPVMAAVSLMASANDPAQPLTMTLMGGPIDTRAAETAVTKLADNKPISWFENTVIHTVPFTYPGAGRLVYPGFLQLTGFMQMNLDRHMDAHAKLFNHLIRGDGESADATKRFYDEYMSVIDLASEFYLETVEQVFQKHLLPRGLMRVGGEPIEPQAIRKTALLTVEGELDDISAPGQTLAAHTLCSGLKAEQKSSMLQAGVGHYGIFNGKRWRENIMPVVRNWIRQHDKGHSAVPKVDLKVVPSVRAA